MLTPIIYAQEPAALHELEGVFGNALSAAIPLVGIAVFVFIVIAGFKYITSSGDPKKAEAAKNTLTYAVIGLVLAALAYLILVLISNFTGQEAILNFRIYQPQ